MSEPTPAMLALAGLGPEALRELLVAVVGKLGEAPRPAVVSNEQAVELHGRARMPIVVPQWTTIGPDGESVARGVVVQALGYKERRQAEERALIRSGPRQGEVDDWRRLLEEVAAGIVEPAGLNVLTIERWNYAVVLHIHAQIERLGELPPALIAQELALLAGGPPPARASRTAARRAESDLAELDSDTGAAE